MTAAKKALKLREKYGKYATDIAYVKRIEYETKARRWKLINDIINGEETDE